MAERQLPVFVEPFICHRARRHGSATTSAAEAVTRSIAIASGLGGTSAYTWLKLPVTDDPDDMAAVMETSTLPAVLLGGEIGDDQDGAYEKWRRRCNCPPCRAWSWAARCSIRPTGTSRRRWTRPWDCCERVRQKT